MNEPIGIKRWLTLPVTFSALLMMPGGGALAEQSGVMDTAIAIGTTTDLSGVTAVQQVNYAIVVRMVFDQANAQGGVNGRKIRYVVEDMPNQLSRRCRRSTRG